MKLVENRVSLSRRKLGEAQTGEFAVNRSLRRLVSLLGLGIVLSLPGAVAAHEGGSFIAAAAGVGRRRSMGSWARSEWASATPYDVAFGTARDRDGAIPARQRRPLRRRRDQGSGTLHRTLVRRLLRRRPRRRDLVPTRRLARFQRQRVRPGPPRRRLGLVPQCGHRQRHRWRGNRRRRRDVRAEAQSVHGSEPRHVRVGRGDARPHLPVSAQRRPLLQCAARQLRPLRSLRLGPSDDRRLRGRHHTA